MDFPHTLFKGQARAGGFTCPPEIFFDLKSHIEAVQYTTSVLSVGHSVAPPGQLVQGRFNSSNDPDIFYW